jgi:transposase
MLSIERIADVKTAKQVALLLQHENDRLHKRNRELVMQIARLRGEDEARQLELEMMRLQEQMSALQRRLFGASSEKRSKSEGGGDKEKKAPRTGHGPREQAELPIVERTHELPADEMTCPSCGGTLVEWEGQVEESEEVTVVERRFVLCKHLRKKYRCTCGACVKTAPAPLRPVEGGRYSTEFAVEAAAQKYLDHLPLERQARIMKREGLAVDSQTLWDQVWALARLYEPTYERIRAHVLAQEVAHGDETPWYLLKKGGRERWNAWAAACHDAVYFHIDRRRSADAADELWAGYAGWLVVDGYQTYLSLAKRKPPGALKLAYCWAHARRKFVEAEPHYPAECGAVLDLIRELYLVEREAPAWEPLSHEGGAVHDRPLARADAVPARCAAAARQQLGGAGDPEPGGGPQELLRQQVRARAQGGGDPLHADRHREAAGRRAEGVPPGPRPLRPPRPGDGSAPERDRLRTINRRRDPAPARARGTASIYEEAARADPANAGGVGPGNPTTPRAGGEGRGGYGVTGLRDRRSAEAARGEGFRGGSWMIYGWYSYAPMSAHGGPSPVFVVSGSSTRALPSMSNSGATVPSAASMQGEPGWRW